MAGNVFDVQIYDTTLRDGTQGEGISFSKADKVRIAERLDTFGIAYIEGGWPGSNPKDMAFFDAMRGRIFKHARLAAFGSTRRAGLLPENDPNLQTLLAAETPVTTIFGKSWLLHVHEVLKVTPDDNLQMVADSCRFLRDNGRETIFDAEHFFDGYNDAPDYAIAVLKAALAGGATALVLCDTNGGMLPFQVQTIVDQVRRAVGPDIVVGIHCHNDSGCAVGNSLAGLQAGCRHVQGTINGFGERTGNADLCAIIPGIALKLGLSCLPDGSLEHLKDLSHYVYEVANLRPEKNRPYVGASAFAHKGGMHVNAVQKNETTFEHIKPEQVGNRRRVLVSDLAGGSNIMIKAAEHNIDLDSKGPEVKNILAELKRLEAEGYEYEAADASFSLLVQKMLNKHAPFFELGGFRVIIEKRSASEPCISEATIKVTVDGQSDITAAEGDGPVNALDRALRKVLLNFYPEIANVGLTDFKVRILEGDAGSAAKTCVQIESSDGDSSWGTVGVSDNIIEASWQALVDSVEYVLYRKR